MKKRMAKRIVTFLLAIVMAAAMPISINAAESTAEPLSVNAKTATFKFVDDMYFELYSGDTVYGEYDTTVVFNSAGDNSNEVYSATVYPDITWNKEFPTDMTGNYRVMVFFRAVYQHLSHYSYGNVTQSYTYKYFNYTGTNSGHFRVPEYTFYIEKPTDDPLGFKDWLYYEIYFLLFLPDWNSGDPYDFVSYTTMHVDYGDVVKQF